jgi:hypothetical protein
MRVAYTTALTHLRSLKPKIPRCRGIPLVDFAIFQHGGVSNVWGNYELRMMNYELGIEFGNWGGLLPSYKLDGLGFAEEIVRN